MQEKTIPVLNSAFEEEVYEGLMAFPKYLSSKYFYDEIGDKLFQDIMAMPEYYLTNCEFNILKKHKELITSIFHSEGDSFSLFELGAGDGKKTKILLEHLSKKNIAFDYRPIDISQNALHQLVASANKELPNVEINPIQGTYFDTLKNIAEEEEKRKVILFLGSNIGNLLHPQAVDFLKKVCAVLNDEDLVFMGFDQKKNPQQILDAYNDKAGITEAFNKNILTRINTEMDANFNLDKFIHWEVYDPETGTAKSYLVSKEEQDVTIKSLDLKVHFDTWESIHTEISQKYDDKVVQWLAEQSGLKITAQFSDDQNFYKNYIFKKA
ncbi:L-histidine N(alpha)-methyltransferase [Croceitalea rosinachiae]|uniref:L-histidine N(Alpha)-methyltransferase n=1 Tax=Croceitalea rosinachiae TaxID=3075596 RepID=A0ABU3A602_9FLAO|nr:L-histidine N(alpha)-methyltransferase [Croceitalea sp. F388]MDT0605588.1 L-histidine N(alpha)-methyltransferase [Croceitalea sp. F388]